MKPAPLDSEATIFCPSHDDAMDVQFLAPAPVLLVHVMPKSEDVYMYPSPRTICVASNAPYNAEQTAMYLPSRLGSALLDAVTALQF